MAAAIERPLTLVFVRHGESEANLVQQADKQGDIYPTK
jgi:broad specificity phosphatase PhoE